MPLNIAQTIRRCMGWCPQKEATPFPGQIFLSGRQATAPPDRNAFISDDLIVDYRSPGLPIPLFLILVVSLSVFIQYFFVIFRPASTLLAVSILLAFIIVEVCAQRKKSGLEISKNAITLIRPFRKPAVIPRDSIVKTEVKENTVPLSPGAIAILLIIVLALCIEPVSNAIYGGPWHANPLRVVYGIIVPLFFVVLLFHAYCRAKFAKTVVITTAKKKVAAIFTDDPGRIVRLLEVS